jgi:polyhydroxyalkanoate synthesis regulator phasin
MPQPKKSPSSGRTSAGRAQGRKAAPEAASKPASSKGASRGPAAKAAGSKGASRGPAAKAAGSKGASGGPAAKAAGSRRGAASGGRTAARKPPASDPRSAQDEREDSLNAALATLRDLLARGVMITGDRLQETMDEAVHRGRMTRDDAEELVQVLLQIGRRQTQDAIAEIEHLIGRAGDETRRRTRSRVRSVAAVARRAPGTDRALRTVDRARRVAGLGTSFPIIGYDELTAAQVKARLPELSPPELRKVRDYERRNANRKSILATIEKQLG